MSSLTTTLINTINATTNLTLQTGNTSAARIVIESGGQGIVLGGNSTSNALFVNSTAVSANITAIFSANVVVPTINASAINLTGSSISTTGYTRLPNGLLMQWGTVSSNTSTGTITFSTAFAAAPYSVQLTSSSNNTTGVGVTSTNTTAAVVRTTSATANTYYYLALGV